MFLEDKQRLFSSSLCSPQFTLSWVYCTDYLSSWKPGEYVLLPLCSSVWGTVKSLRVFYCFKGTFSPLRGVSIQPLTGVRTWLWEFSSQCSGAAPSFRKTAACSTGRRPDQPALCTSSETFTKNSPGLRKKTSIEPSCRTCRFGTYFFSTALQGIQLFTSIYLVWLFMAFQMQLSSVCPNATGDGLALWKDGAKMEIKQLP